MTLEWHRRKGIGGLYAALDADRRYSITPTETEGYDLSLFSGGRYRHLGRYAKQVEAKRAAEALPE